MKILVDGLNFELPQGTGIKTYSRSVISALSQLGHSIDLLSGKSFRKVRHVAPLDAYLADMATLPTGRRISLARRISASVALPGKIFKGDIDLQTAEHANLLERLQCPEWRHVNRVRVKPGFFLKAYARAGLGFGISRAVEFKDNDLLFLTSPIPIRIPGRLNVLTVHDLIPLSHPWLMDDRWINTAKAIGSTLEHGLTKADRVICISRATQEQLVARFDVDERKISVVYHPCRHSFAQDSTDCELENAVLQDLGLSNAPYLLFVGAIEPKKNLVNVLRALALNKNLPRLVIAGSYAWSSSREKSMISSMKDRVTHLGFLPDRELCILQKHAAAFVFPSLVEGFGLPPLEAMWHGVPCVLSDIAVFRELFGDHAILVDPYSPGSIATGISEALNLSQHRRDQAASYVKTRFSFQSFKNDIGNALQI